MMTFTKYKIQQLIGYTSSKARVPLFCFKDGQSKRYIYKGCNQHKLRLRKTVETKTKKKPPPII